MTRDEFLRLVRQYRQERNPGRVLALWAAIERAIPTMDSPERHDPTSQYRTALRERS